MLRNGDDDDDDESTGSDLRAGASVRRAEVPVGAGEGPAGTDDRAVADPGQDLVPEPPLQGQEGPAGPTRDRQCTRREAASAGVTRTRQGHT